MDRRTFCSAVAGTTALGLAGCLDRFETRSAWAQPPLVEDRPDAVYLPPASEQMGSYGIQTVGELRVGLFYTFPHRFWVVTGEEDNRTDIGDDDIMHLMASVWDPETGLVPPAEIAAEIRSDGESVEAYQLWPMLSQRMGFHYGDNVALDGPGSYAIDLQIDPTSARTTGAVADRFDERFTTTIEFEFDSNDVFDLDFEFIDRERRGERGATPLMVDDHGGEHAGDGEHGDDGGHADNHAGGDEHGGDHGHPPPLKAPDPATLPGELFDLGSTGDARFFATVLEEGPTGEGQYLAVSARTPHNRVSLPLMALSLRVDRGGSPVLEDRLFESLDDRLGHHYGRAVDLQDGDEVTVSIEAPPQASRHDGYETAFYGMVDRVFEYQG